MKNPLLLIPAALVLAACASPPQRANSAPPPKPVQDTYFGTTVTDPFRYFENLKDPDVQAWFKSQADHARTVLDAIPGHQALLDKLTEISNAVPARVTDVSEVPGRIFYNERKSGENQFKLYTRQGWDGPEQLLLDPDKLIGADGEPVAINYYTPSPSGRYVAVGVSHGGSEDASIHVIEVSTGTDTGVVIDRAQFGDVGWRDDESGFFYNRLKERPAGSPSTLRYQDTQMCYHQLGADPAKDPSVFGTDAPGGVELTPVYEPMFVLIYGDPRVFAVLEDGDRREIAAYATTLAALDAGKPAWRRLFNFDDDIIDFSVHGDDLYALSHKDAPRFKYLRTDVNAPDFAKAEVVIPPGEAVLEATAVAKDALYVTTLDGGIEHLWQVPFGAGAKPQEVSLPVKGSVADLVTNTRIAGAKMRLGSWINAGGYYAFDPATGQTTDTHLEKPGPYDQPDDLVAEEVRVPSHDGVLVPLSVIHKKGIKLDGSNPCWVDAYGSYGIVDTPYFSPSLLEWYERGGIYAIAQVRGGGAFGEEWHTAGQKLNKPNTWKDLIACCEWLVSKGYTSHEKLGISGGSAGGITVGRAMTARPDLFKAVVGEVGVFNTVRAETDANGVPNVPEFGTVTKPDEFKGLLEMDSYLHVVDGTKYPAVLLTTGMNDPRVPPWHVGKFAARLEQAGAPLVLLRVDYAAGHSIGSTKAQRLAELADTMAFFFWQFGVPGFQPK